MHEGLGFTPTKISEMKEIAQRFSRAVTADIRMSANIALQENNFMVVPQYYWMPVSADEINTSPKPEATASTEAKTVAEGNQMLQSKPSLGTRRPIQRSVGLLTSVLPS